eukprot:3342695-Pyramimonas_sp.AAC.1
MLCGVGALWIGAHVLCGCGCAARAGVGALWIRARVLCGCVCIAPAGRSVHRYAASANPMRLR